MKLFHVSIGKKRWRYLITGLSSLLTLRFDFKYDGGGIGKGGMGTLSVEGTQVAKAQIERTVGVRFSLDETFDVGEDTGTALIQDYAAQMPFRFTGDLENWSCLIDVGKACI